MIIDQIIKLIWRLLRCNTLFRNEKLQPIIISVHLPKTAGTSFASSLEDYFGEDLLKDYNIPVMSIPPCKRNWLSLKENFSCKINFFLDIKCIHGHFLPIKYLILSMRRNVKFVVWMRHPVERVVSHYFFWKRNYDPQYSHALCKRMVEENWSLERFCLGPEVKNLYSQYLWGFPVEYFNFIGITEFYNEDIEYFAQKFLKNSMNIKKINVNNENRKGENYDIDPLLRQKIALFHRKDMQLYEKALLRRVERLGKDHLSL